MTGTLEWILNAGVKPSGGFFYNGEFYKDRAHTELMVGKNDALYLDLTNLPPVLYTYRDGQYYSLSGVGSFTVVVVAELPETGDVGTLYLVPRETPDVHDYCDEYIWVREQESPYIPAHFEPIGTTQIDLSNYWTKLEADGRFVLKADMLDEGTVTLYEVGSTTPHTYKTYIEEQ